jgi:putative acetyltransferase
MQHNAYPLAGTMFSIRLSRPADGDRVVTIWRDAVDATHHFLAA